MDRAPLAPSAAPKLPEPCRFAFDGLDRKRPCGEAHFARLPVRDKVDRGQVRLPLQGARHLRDGGVGLRKNDCLDIWPETRHQCVEIRDGGVDEGDLVRIGHDASRGSWFYWNV